MTAIPLRLYIYAACALALVGLLWHDHHQTHRANAAVAKLRTTEATLATERENTRKATEASERYAQSIKNLELARAATPVRSVRICPASVPQSRPATRTDESGSAEFSPPPGPDIKDRWSDDGPDVGPYLYALADEADTCHATLEALQGWVRGR